MNPTLYHLRHKTSTQAMRSCNQKVGSKAWISVCSSVLDNTQARLSPASSRVFFMDNLKEMKLL